MNSRLLIVLNREASRVRQVWPEVSSRLAQHSIQFELHETRAAGEATAAVRAAVRGGNNLIAVVGGDGTISEVVEGFFETAEGSDLPQLIDCDARLAIIPAGTGDDFARGILETSTNSTGTENWIDRLVSVMRHDYAGEIRKVDVVRGVVEETNHSFIFANVATMGIGPDTALGVAAQKGMMRKLPGEARFVAAALKGLLRWRERKIRITVDEAEPFNCSTNLLAVANSIYAGGGMKFAPRARVDDGMLDLLIANDLNRREIMRELPRIRTGGHLSNPKVKMFVAKHIRIEHIDEGDSLLVEADGNLRGQTPVNFTVMPGALSLVV